MSPLSRVLPFDFLSADFHVGLLVKLLLFGDLGGLSCPKLCLLSLSTHPPFALHASLLMAHTL